jgi:translation initiation factor 3 subunit L
MSCKSVHWNNAHSTVSNHFCLLFIHQTGQLRKLPGSDQFFKNFDRMIALLAICTHVCPQSNLAEESVAKTIREKHGAQLSKEAYSDLFVYCSPKFVSPAVPDFSGALTPVAAAFFENNAYKHQVHLLEQELECQSSVRTLRSYLKLYTSIAISKLVAFGNDELTLLALKLKLRQRESDSVPSLEQATLKSALDIHYYFENETVHINEAEKQRRFENYFLNQTVQSFEIRKDANAITTAI